MDQNTPMAYDPNAWNRPLVATDEMLSFGDTVRVRPSPATEAKGLAGRMGVIRGETTPSVTCPGRKMPSARGSAGQPE